MEPILSALNSALNFIYNNVLSIAMLVLLIAVGFFLTVRLRGFQLRRFGYIMKNTFLSFVSQKGIFIICVYFFGILRGSYQPPA